LHLTVYRQGEIFYYAFLYGIVLGVYYDFYRLLRYLGFKSKYAVIAQDITFMCTAAVMCFLFAEVTVNGHIRAFIIFGHLFGIFSYRYSFGMLSGFGFKLISSAVTLIKNTFVNIFKNIMKIFRRNSSSFVKKSAN